MRSKLYKFLNQFSTLFLKSSPTKLRVLAYHTVPDASKFEKQINYLKSNFNIIDIKSLELAFKGKMRLPEKALLITFDDGDYSLYEKGLPILKRYDIPAVVFIISGLIETNKAFWWKTVETYYKQQGKTYAEARKKVNVLKQSSETDRRKYLANIPILQQRQLNIKELNEFEDNNITIANHTHTHPMVNNCSIEQLKDELDKVQNSFREWGFSGFDIFAYPNGNWDIKTETYIRSRINIAFLFDHKLNSFPINPMRISRIKVDTFDDLSEFKVKVSGIHPKLLEVKQSLKI